VLPNVAHRRNPRRILSNSSTNHNRGMAKSVCLITIGGMVAIGWLLIAVVDPSHVPAGASQTAVGSVLLGTLFGQVSLAAAWCALGPYTLIRRLPMSAVWLSAILLAFGCNVAREGESNGLLNFLLFGSMLLTQWLLIQAPIWLVVVWYGLRITDELETDSIFGTRDRQFGTREIMILTALVAIVLGTGRLLLGGLKADGSFGDWTVALLFGLMSLSNAAIALPLIAASIARRNWFRSLCLALLLSVFTTAIELSLFSQLTSMGRGYWMFASANLVQCSWIVTVLLFLRAGGFRLVSRQRASEDACPTTAG
jgi:hypothetical protein